MVDHHFKTLFVIIVADGSLSRHLQVWNSSLGQEDQIYFYRHFLNRFKQRLEEKTTLDLELNVAYFNTFIGALDFIQAPDETDWFHQPIDLLISSADVGDEIDGFSFYDELKKAAGTSDSQICMFGTDSLAQVEHGLLRRFGSNPSNKLFYQNIDEVDGVKKFCLGVNTHLMKMLKAHRYKRPQLDKKEKVVYRKSN